MSNIFYEIIAPNGQKSYLFGTIHINDPQVCTLPLEVKRALDNCRCCLVETTLSRTELMTPQANDVGTRFTKLQMELMHCLWLEENLPGLQQATFPTPYIQDAKEYLRQKLRIQGHTKVFTDEQLQINTPKIPPILVAKNIMDPEITIEQATNTLDDQISTMCMHKLIGLEDPISQVKITNGYNLNYLEQLEFYTAVHHFLASGGVFPDTESIKRAYFAGNDLKPVLWDEDAPGAVKKYYQAYINDRDMIMANAMKPHLEAGNAFTAVGVRHLSGITKILRTDGYAVNPISLSERKYPITASIIDMSSVVGVATNIDQPKEHRFTGEFFTPCNFSPLPKGGSAMGLEEQPWGFNTF